MLWTLNLLLLVEWRWKLSGGEPPFLTCILINLNGANEGCVIAVMDLELVLAEGVRMKDGNRR
jgi:hypothetical protein